MSFPASLTVVTVHGTVLDGAGLPRTGRVIFRTPGFTMSSADDTAVIPRVRAVSLDSAGHFSIDLPSSTDPDWTPVGWTYNVTMDFGVDGSQRYGAIVVPHDLGSSLSLFALAPVPAANGQLYALYNDPRFSGTGGGGGGAVSSVFGRSGVVVAANGDYTKAQVGLGNVDNTSDAGKPISSATATALGGKAATVHTHAESDVTGLVSDLASLASGIAGKSSLGHAHVESDVTGLVSDLALKAPIASPTFTGTVGGITKAMVGLGSVDNTADSGKPVSTAQAAAIALKADLASPTFTGTVSGISKTMVGLSNVDNTADTAKPVSTAQATAIGLKANTASPTFTGTVGGISAAMVGLGNVDNTSDLNKPISTAQAAVNALKAPLASPALTGAPTVPTATPGTNTTQAASTAFVTAAVAAGGGGGGAATLPDALNPKGGRWSSVPVGRAGVNYTPVINRLHLMPLPIGPVDRILTGLNCEVATAAGAGGLVRFMILDSLASGEWEPNLAIFDYGTVATDTTGSKAVTSMTDTLTKNKLYWVGLNFTVAVPAVRAVDDYNPYVNLSTALTGTNSFGMFVMNSVSGPLGATPFTYFDVDIAIRVGVRFS